MDAVGEYGLLDTTSSHIQPDVRFQVRRLNLFVRPLKFFFSVFTVGDLAASNTILFTANLGLGFYVYFRHHLHRLKPWDRVEFSVFSTTLFNFGSLLAAVLIKALLPNKTPTWTRCLLGSALSVYLLSRAHKYLHYVDERSARKTPTPRRQFSDVIFERITTVSVDGALVMP
ncbi:hypothetical protein Y032_0275g1041 [Ancylostoma ceylanicum]|uniref:Uncharacterized protein n=2 Tax=Ancylostoma ceylanicum TaxID=53326 RepID=A0A016S8Q8_9BILA|nr:hypothetical protein Y032_0275g1041 [Ancylostoma ceylanicum]